MKRIGRILLGSAFLLCIASACMAGSDVLRVPEDGYSTIGEAIDDIADAGTIIVAPGTYYEHDIDFGGRRINLMAASSGAPADTVIDCQDMGRALHFHSGETAEAKVRGFTLMNGNAAGGSGGAILCENGSNPAIFNCVIRASEADYGGAIAAVNAHPRIENCLLYDNEAAFGGGIYADAGSNITVINCTVAHNTATDIDGYGGVQILSEGATVLNSILWQNVPVEAAISGTVGYSCLESSHGGASNFSAGPVFADSQSRDFHIQAVSTVIDAGSASLEPYGSTSPDMSPDTGIIDIGYHFGVPSDMPPGISMSQPHDNSSSNNVRQPCLAHLTDDIGLAQAILYLDNAEAVSEPLSGTIHDLLYQPPAPLREGWHVYRLEVTDNGGNTAVFTAQFRVRTAVPAGGIKPEMPMPNYEAIDPGSMAASE